MECPKCGREMWQSPFVIATNPPITIYKCYCGHREEATGKYIEFETYTEYQRRIEREDTK